MRKKCRIIVTKESKTGRNLNFQDTSTGITMTRAEFVKNIENGKYSKDYHVRNINGVKTPASNPDKDKNNNLD